LLSVIATDPAKHLFAAYGPAMWPVGLAGEAAFIEIHHVFFAVAAYPVPQGAEERYSFFVMTFSIGGRFF
jgi:hypothetical protein